MKKDQKSTEQNSLQQTTVQENHSRTIQIIQEINHHITQVIEEDRQNEENTQNSSQNHYNRPNSRSKLLQIKFKIHNDLFLDLIPNQEITTTQTTNHEIHHTIGIETTPIIENRSYSNNRNQNYPNSQSRNNSYNRSNYNRPNNNYQNRSQNNSQNRHSSYNNRYRNYSQSPHRNNNNYNRF